MTRKFLLGFAALLLLMLGGGYGIVSWSMASREEVHARAIAALEQALPGQVAPQLNRLVTASSQPEVLLCSCLQSKRAVLVEAANLELMQQITQWRELPRQQAARRLCDLVEQINATIPKMSPAGRLVARQQVEQALRWPLLPGSRHTPELLSTCQQVLAKLDQADSPVHVADRTAEASLTPQNVR